MHGAGIRSAPAQYVSSNGYDYTHDDGSPYVDVKIWGRDYGPRSIADLNGSFGRSLGIRKLGGFYLFPNDYTATIHGRLAVTGTEVLSFEDYSPSGSFISQSSAAVDHVWYPPHGAHWVTTSNLNVTADRGSSIHWDVAASNIHEWGTVNGSYYFNSPWDWGYSGGAYVGNVQATWSY
jgi:hypothetical protein